MQVFKGIEAFSKKLTDLYFQLAMLFMFALIFATFMQVFTRYVLNSSWPWTEEMARYAFIWMNMVGAAAGLRKGSLVAIDYLPNSLKGVSKKVLLLIIFTLEFLGGLVLFVQGIRLITLVGGSPSIVMRFPMGFVHVSIPIGGFGFMVNSMALAIETYQKENENTSIEEGGAV